MLPSIIGLNTGGASVKQVMHYAQGVNSGLIKKPLLIFCGFKILASCNLYFFSGEFRQYDFGMLINLSKYGSFQPPEYDLRKVTCPVALFYGNNDWLVSERVDYFLCL